MRKALLTLTIIIVSALTGCGGSVWANCRPVETLLPVQTVGLDAAGAALELTVSAPEEPGGAAALLSASGGSLEEAAAALERWSAREELFFPHVRFALVGRAAAEQGLEGLFHWFTGSGRSRLDLPVLILREGSARQLMEGARTGEQEITGVLEALKRTEDQPVTLLDVMAQLRRSGAAVCPAVAAAPVGDHVPGAPEGAMTALAAGWAVLREDGLAGYLTAEETLGAALLLRRADTLEDIPGARVKPLRLSARWEGDTLAVRLLYSARLSQPPSGSREAAEAAIDGYLSGCIRAALDRAAAMEADFLDVTGGGGFPAGAVWDIQVRGTALPPAGREAQA